MDLYLAEGFQDALLGERLEPLTCALLERLLKPGDCFVDVGYLSLLAAVLSFEVQPENCVSLYHNVRVNGFTNVELLMATASNEAGFVSLHMQAPSDRTTLSLEEPEPNALP